MLFTTGCLITHYQQLRQPTIDQPDLDNSSTEALFSGKCQLTVKDSQHSHFHCLPIRVVVLIELGVKGSKVTGTESNRECLGFVFGQDGGGED